MPQWSSSTRRFHLPPDWPKTRLRILRNAMWMCQVRLDNGKPCGAQANEVDHIKPGDDHRDSNLRAICQNCHSKKSSSEGGKARAAKRAAINQKFRRTEVHPGLL